jgi:hypothetical protein
LRTLSRLALSAVVALAGVASGVAIAIFVPAMQRLLLLPGALIVSILAGLRVLSANDRAEVIFSAVIIDGVLLWIVVFIVLQMRAVARERRSADSTNAAV